MLQVKRELKRAKLFSIQKISKRIKQLERKKGTENQLQKNRRKAQRLVDELELIKELNLNNLASEVFQACTEGTFAVNSKSSHGEDPRERAKWRLLSSKQFQLGLGRINSPPVAQEPSAGSQTFHSGTLSDDDSGTGDTVSDCADVQESVSEEEISSDPELDPGLSGTTAAGMNSRELHHKNEHLISVKGEQKQKFLAKRRVKKTGRKSILLPKRLSKAMRRTRECSDEEDIGISLTDEDRSGSRSRAMKLDSMFLDSLDCSSKSEGEKAQKKRKKQRNRLGQRARKREWEKLYRAQARHLQKHKQQSDRVIKGSQANSKGSSGSSRSSTHHVPAAAVEPEELHPSWAASRRKKALERGIHEFQGQKVVFSDSD